MSSEQVRSALPAHALRVLVVADDGLTRAGLAALLAEQAGIAVLATLAPGQVADGSDLTLLHSLHEPDVIVWDLGWHDPMRHIEHLAAIADDAPPLLVIAAQANDHGALWIAGVRGILHRAATGAQIAVAVQALALGLAVASPELPFSESLTSSQSATFRETKADGESLTQGIPAQETLTPRELEVLQAIADGMANKQIARALGMSEHTVKFHVNAILGKLGASSRTDAVVRATRAGVLLL